MPMVRVASGLYLNLERYIVDDSQPPKQLPQWLCHKKVWAAKIESIEYPPQETTSRVLLHLEGGFEVSVKKGWGEALGELVGGYFVRYADGFESWSPAAAFEDGYTLIGPDVHAEGACPPEVGEEDPSIVETAPPSEG